MSETHIHTHTHAHIFVPLNLHTTHIYLTFLRATADLFSVGSQVNPNIFSTQIAVKNFTNTDCYAVY